MGQDQPTPDYGSTHALGVDGLDGATWRGLPFNSAVLPIIVLLGSTAVCLAVAIWRFRWEE